MSNAVKFVKCTQEQLDSLNKEMDKVDVYLDDNVLYFVKQEEGSKVEKSESANPFLEGIEFSFENFS